MAINPACNALTSLARLRAAGFGGQAAVGQLQMAINAVSAMVERQCDRVFRAVTYGEGGDEPAELVQGSGRRILLLSTYPIIEVTKVVIAGTEVSDWRLIPSHASWGALYRATRWPRVEGAWGSLVGDPDGDADYNIEVSYTGGLAEVPADLELAVMQEVDLVTGGKAAKRVKSERTAGGWSITYAGQEYECSLSSRSVFEGYKRRDL